MNLPFYCPLSVSDESFLFYGENIMSKLKNRFGSKVVSMNTPVKKGLYSQSPGNCAGCSNSTSQNCNGSGSPL
jgi:hypothetical protein